MVGGYSLQVTPLSWYSVPEALEVRVLPSDEVKMFLEVPTVTNELFPYLNAQNCLKKNSQQINQLQRINGILTFTEQIE